MAKFEDYLPGAAKDPNRQSGGSIEHEIHDAQGQQAARQDPSTQQTDWEQRYKELEKLNSRQAQTLGEYRKTIDQFIANPTPDPAANPSEEESGTFSLDDFYEDPNKAVLKAVESHPAIREARELKRKMVDKERESALEQFTNRHSDYNDIGTTPEFQNWVADNPMRMELYQRADGYDFSAADALFSLYKAEKGIRQINTQREIDQAELVSSSGEMAPKEPPRYSRHEYINKLTRARQGDLEAEDWVKANAAGYRMALASGNVRD
jgi:hypothetical protein